MSVPHRQSAFLVRELPSARQIAQNVLEPLTFAFALACGIFGTFVGWQANDEFRTWWLHPAAARYADAMCRSDVAYLQHHTGESAGPMPWEPRLSSWSMPCHGKRYLGTSTDRIGREQHVFALLQRDGTAVVFVVTFGHDGLAAGVD
jgi:hypothetical protein